MNTATDNWTRPENWPYAGRHPTAEEFANRVRLMDINRAATIEEFQPGYWAEIAKVDE